MQIIVFCIVSQILVLIFTKKGFYRLDKLSGEMPAIIGEYGIIKIF